MMNRLPVNGYMNLPGDFQPILQIGFPDFADGGLGDNQIQIFNGTYPGQTFAAKFARVGQ
jgi:hypothetical protein